MGARRRVRRATVAALACAVAAIAAPALPAHAQSGGTQGVTDTEIKVGGMGSSTAFFSEETVGLGAKARFERANKTGELPGKRKITMVAWGDDKFDPATSVNEERRLIEQEGVFAIVPLAGIVYRGIVANQTGTPVFEVGYDPAACPEDTSDYFVFSFQGCRVPPEPKYAIDHMGIVKSALEKEGIVPAGETARVALIAPDNAAGKQSISLWAAAAREIGMEPVYVRASTPAPPAVVGDYAPYVRDILATDPDVVISHGQTSDYIGLANALRAANFEGMYLIPSADPALAGIVGPSYGITQWGPPESADTTPAIQQLLDDLDAYEPGTKAGTLNTLGWLAADHFITAVKKAGKNLTAEKLQKVASKMTYELDGFIGPTPYPKAWKDAGAPACHAIVKTDGSSYTVVEPYQCSKKKWPATSYEEEAVG